MSLTSSLAANAKDANVPGMAPDLQVNDFTIRTHPKDTLVMAGGTNLGGNNKDVVNAINQNTEAVRQDKSIAWDNWGASNVSDHLATGKVWVS